MNSGWMPFDGPSLTESQIMLNRLMAHAPQFWEGSRDDTFSFQVALEYLQCTLCVFYIGLATPTSTSRTKAGTTAYRAMHSADAYLQLLWEKLQSHPQYRGTTTMIVTTDHGRGDPPLGWRDHGETTKGSGGHLDRHSGSGHAGPRRADQYGRRDPGPSGRDDRGPPR